MVKIRHGFVGQRLIALPFHIIERALNNPLTSDLAIHSIGYFPRAEGHFIHRENGCGEYLLIYCTKGEGWFLLNDQLHIVPANSFFILPAEQPHQYGSSEHDPWCIYWIHFKGAKAREVSDRLPGLQSIEIDEHSRIDDRISFFEELISALQLGNDDDIITFANLSFNHLLSTFLFIQTYRDIKTRKGCQPNTFFVSRATHYMNENLEKKISLHEIASYFGYSVSYFYRLFQKETGYSPISYFLRIKIERSSQLLIHTDMKINQIAFKLGFEDPYYFSRFFTKINGMSPKKYREKKKE
jgi:AraC-like DNA-binding protein